MGVRPGERQGLVNEHVEDVRAARRIHGNGAGEVDAPNSIRPTQTDVSPTAESGIMEPEHRMIGISGRSPRSSRARAAPIMLGATVRQAGQRLLLTDVRETATDRSGIGAGAQPHLPLDAVAPRQSVVGPGRGSVARAQPRSGVPE